MTSFLAIVVPAVWLGPLLPAGVVQFVLRDPRRQRAAAIAVAWLVFLAALAMFLVNASGEAFARDDVEAGPLLALHYHMAVDGLNAVLLPMTAALALGALLSAPRSDVRGDTAARILVVEGALLGGFLSLDLAVLAAFWVASMLPLWQDTRRSGSRPLHLVMTLAVAITAAALTAAVVGVAASGATLDLVAGARADHPGAPASWALLALDAYRQQAAPASGASSGEALLGERSIFLHGFVAAPGAIAVDARSTVLMGTFLGNHGAAEQGLSFVGRGAQVYYQARLRFAPSQLPREGLSAGFEIHRSYRIVPSGPSAGAIRERRVRDDDTGIFPKAPSSSWISRSAPRRRGAGFRWRTRSRGASMRSIPKAKAAKACSVGSCAAITPGWSAAMIARCSSRTA